MADLKISQLTGATTPLAGTEVFPLVQSSATVKATISNVQTAPVSTGTAHAIPYLNGSKAPTYNTSVLSTFDGSCLLLNNASRWASEKFGITGTDAATRFSYWRTTANGHYVSLGTDATNLYLDYGNGSGFDIKSGATVAINVDGSSNVKFSTGNLVQGTAAKGVNFTANTPAAGMTSQLLNWYEEGTFTPTIILGGGSVTYTTQTGTYTRIGRLVTVQIRIVVNVATTPSGSLEIGALPFTSSANQKGAVSILVNTMTALATTTWMGITTASSNAIRLFTYAAGALADPGSYIQNSSQIAITASYEV